MIKINAFLLHWILKTRIPWNLREIVDYITSFCESDLCVCDTTEESRSLFILFDREFRAISHTYIYMCVCMYIYIRPQKKRRGKENEAFNRASIFRGSHDLNIDCTLASRNFISIAITRFNYDQRCLLNNCYSLFNDDWQPSLIRNVSFHPPYRANFSILTEYKYKQKYNSNIMEVLYWQNNNIL